MYECARGLAKEKKGQGHVTFAMQKEGKKEGAVCMFVYHTHLL
jgi:hypothetical protein